MLIQGADQRNGILAGHEESQGIAFSIGVSERTGFDLLGFLTPLHEGQSFTAIPLTNSDRQILQPTEVVVLFSFYGIASRGLCEFIIMVVACEIGVLMQS